MNKKFCLIALALALFAFSPAYAQMSDEAILKYITEGMASGKTQSQIGNELLAKGVTVSQAKRLIQSYKSGNVSSFAEAKVSSQLDKASKTSVRKKSEVENEETLPESKVKADLKEEKSPEDTLKHIFGHDIFSNSKLSFEPNMNMATPASYVLGPGDELIIDVWGENEVSMKETISSEGRINISQVGPVVLSGLNITQATAKLKKVLAAKYSLSGQNPSSSLSVTLGNVRSIQVSVMGEVKVPGTYRLSSLSTLFHAVYRAGGVSEIGSLRNIRLVRDGKTVETADMYRLLFDGVDGGNAALKDGDVVIVPPYTALVEITGGVKRPMLYETTGAESARKIITYAGGFSSDAYLNEVTIQRKNGHEGYVFTVQPSDLNSLDIQDGDVITVYTNKQEDVFKNRIEIKGCVLRPGVYALGGEIATVRQLVEHAGGLLENAFMTRAQLIREKADRSMEIKAVALGAIVDGSAEDIVLRRSDILIVYDKNEIDVKGDLVIKGFVMNPGSYTYADGMSVEDLILLAGGLADGAKTAKVDVSRRIVDFESATASDTLATVFSFNIADGLLVDGDPEFVLQPYDIVSVRRSPSYREQSMIRVSGEVNFPGEYALQTNNERLSDIFKRVNGATPNAYLQGAMLRRKVSEDERNVRRNMVNMIQKGGQNRDSLMIKKLTISEYYTIGIDLVAALEHPGSGIDVVLHDGDELIIPSSTNTVRIQGEVMYPNAVHYMPGRGVGYYIRQAGGFSNEAKRSKVYVVYMNGKVSVGANSRIVPGCEVVVPARPERQKMTIGEWLGIGTTAASITTMVATISNMVKK